MIFLINHCKIERLVCHPNLNTSPNFLVFSESQKKKYCNYWISRVKVYFPLKFSHNNFLAFCLKQACNYNLQFLVTTNLFHYLFWKVEIVLVYLKKRWMYFSKVFINTTMQTQYKSLCIRLHLYIQSIPSVVGVFIYFFVVFHPTREFSTYLETCPLPVKGCKILPMLGTQDHWAVRVL